MTLQPPDSIDRSPAWLAGALDWARARGATDLHFFPAEREALLWARLDGELREVARYPLAAHERMVARLKVLGRCADYDGGLVQEGRFMLDGAADAGEARLSVVQTLRGEKAVVRLLAGGVKLRRLDELGFGDAMMATLRDAMDCPQGLILAVGPSGCGKSTTLYALVDDLCRRAGRPVSAVTIEDPVEQTLPCAAQIAAQPARGLGFAEGLRAVLRQDPEVIMIGEIRDAATAAAALQAALTGHRILSSMHTLSAAEALVRLQQMGSAPYVISSALAGILNQRLVRRLCPHCQQKPAVQSGACEACLGSGRLGRAALGEWLVATPDTAAALQGSAPAAVLARTLDAVVTARASAEALIAAGAIAPEECARLTGLATLAASSGDRSGGHD